MSFIEVALWSSRYFCKKCRFVYFQVLLDFSWHIHSKLKEFYAEFEVVNLTVSTFTKYGRGQPETGPHYPESWGSKITGDPILETSERGSPGSIGYSLAILLP